MAKILKRSSILSLLLLVGVIFVGERVYRVWSDDGPQGINKTQDGKPPAVRSPAFRPRQSGTLDTQRIIEKNLFDPERGTGQVQQTQVSSGAMQQVQKMILLGTAILGPSRYALFEEGSGGKGPARARARPGQQNILRLKLGDTVEGFELSEIHEKKVVFTKGASKVEIALDFFRKVDNGNKQPVTSRPTRAQPRQAVSPRSRTPRQAVQTPRPARRP